MEGYYTKYLRELGEFLQQQRLNKNWSQEQLSAQCGLSRRTISQMENGGGGTIMSLLQYLQAINRLDVWEQFDASIISPLKMAKLLANDRQRATGKRQVKPKKVRSTFFKIKR